jgi:cyclopropane-fatty-acyl-phospholipid synthase
MADKGDIFVSYDAMDALWRNSMIRLFGEDVPVDFTGARYEGIYPGYGEEIAAYIEAQANKRAYVLDQIGFQEGQVILDVGCGWGNMLREIEQNFGMAIGLTLSPAQVGYCQEKGLDARLVDWNDYHPDRKFDGVVSIGAFEHFCSIDAFREGRQMEVYRDFFELVYNCLKSEKKFYLQTMIFGGKGVPDLDVDINPRAPKGSPQRIIAQWKAYFPGSYLPHDEEQIVEAASDFFELTRAEDGREDYIETARVWLEAINAPGGLEKSMEWLNFALKGLGRDELLTRLQSVREDAFSRGFAYDIIGHRRLTFVRKD